MKDFDSNVRRVIELKQQQQQIEREIRGIIDAEFIHHLVEYMPGCVSINWSMLRRRYM